MQENSPELSNKTQLNYICTMMNLMPMQHGLIDRMGPLHATETHNEKKKEQFLNISMNNHYEFNLWLNMKW